MGKLYSVGVGVLVAALRVAAAQADGPDISAQRLLDSWKDDDPGIKMIAEVIASAFASVSIGVQFLTPHRRRKLALTQF